MNYLKPQFCFKIYDDLEKIDVIFRIGKLWREYICKLWNELYEHILSKNDFIKNVLNGVIMDQWVVC